MGIGSGLRTSVLPKVTRGPCRPPGHPHLLPATLQVACCRPCHPEVHPAASHSPAHHQEGPTRPQQGSPTAHRRVTAVPVCLNHVRQVMVSGEGQFSPRPHTSPQVRGPTPLVSAPLAEEPATPTAMCPAVLWNAPVSFEKKQATSRMVTNNPR